MRLIFFILLFCFCSNLNGQTAKRYWVELSDKASTPYSISNPAAFLSAKAIDRRLNQGIDITLNDLPVDPSYVAQIAAVPTVTVWVTSKWFNAVSVEVTDSTMVDSILNLPFVVQVDTVRMFNIDLKEEVFNEKSTGHTNYHDEYYGIAFKQIEMLGGHLLHSEGYTGRGKTIAVLDAGFRKVDSVDVFQNMIAEGRLVATKDMVDRDDYVFSSSQHGTAVLSCMGANLPGKMVGTAPGASFILIRSEDVSSESLAEEDNWIGGAEFADSLGADIFNTSLGYTEFNDTMMNHNYADLDGNTARISIAADIAASKGILVITSAGNLAEQPWYYISAPGDADSSLTVAAVDSFLVRAPFSSFGPSADGDLKPNVAAMGFRTACTFPNGEVRTANGTSFSSPVLAGMAACLWEAFPDKTNMEIKSLIEKHGHQYLNPDFSLGYGVPNFYRAYLDAKGEEASADDELISVFPSNFSTKLTVKFHSNSAGSWKLRMVNSVGQVVFEKELQVTGNEYVQSVFTDEIANLGMGMYFVHLQKDNDSISVKKVIKTKP
ncbi:MAG: serine protease AprX [Parvicellaceae bacterium]|jgi:serine protease AprX